MSNEPDKIIYSMIRVSKRHGQKEVLKDISLSYFYGAKIGVLGLNGAGKSSLLKILAGVDQAFDGKTVLAPGYTIGYLEQEPLAGETRTVREVVEEGVSDLAAIAREFEEINAKFAEPMEPEEMDALIARQAEVQEQMDAKGVWDLESAWKWPWTPCAARRATCRWSRFPAANAAAWPFAACCSRIPTFCSWTNPPTTWTPSPWPGWSAICPPSRARSSP